MSSPLGRVSFQVKLLLSFALVILLATFVGYLFINSSVNRAFTDFTDFAGRSFSEQDEVILQFVAEYYGRVESVDELVDLIRQGTSEGQGAGGMGIPVAVVDADENVRYRPGGGPGGPSNASLSPEQLADGIELVLANGETAMIVPLFREARIPPELEEAFLRTTQRSLWWSALVVGLVGAALALLLLRQVTQPLRLLDDATQRITRGNLSERVRIESGDEIGHLARSFNEMAESLEESERTQKRMIADISHELRTPITAVRSALESLRDGLIPPTQEVFAGLHDRILLFTRLVNDLQQLALADAGHLSIHAVSTEIRDLIEGIEETIGVELEDAGLELHVELEPDLPAVSVDPHRIEQVLLNLLSNAMRHAREAGQVIIAAGRVDGKTIEISVCDDGPGLSKLEQAHVFERFYRVDAARASDGGSGLGLAIAKAIVEQHGGRIRVENGPGGGACFRFTLPI